MFTSVEVIDTDSGLTVYLAELAVQALLDEVNLTPKPGLVDRRGSGAHQDLTLALMERSAHSLRSVFHALALAGWQRRADSALRQQIGRIGRAGEQRMMQVTDGVNTHRGAIWALGLLVAAVAMQGGKGTPQHSCRLAAELAQLTDLGMPKHLSNGQRASQRYQVAGAREEAQQGFPHVINIALPQLWQSRHQGANEQAAQINALMAIMMTLSDTCVLSRGGMPALHHLQQGAVRVLQAGGYQSPAGQAAFARLDQQLQASHVSPGGAADLLAAALFLDRVIAR